MRTRRLCSAPSCDRKPIYNRPYCPRHFPPTDIQVGVLRLIDGARIPPTVREIVEALGIRSTNGANDHVSALVKRGLLERLPMKARGLLVTAAGKRVLADWRWK